MDFGKKVNSGSRLIQDRKKVVDEKLEMWNVANNGLGIDAIRDYTGKFWDRYYGSTVILYVNVGDAYTKTLAYCVVNNKFYLGDIETLFDKIPRKLAKALCGN